jgi:hypothetical protein
LPVDVEAKAQIFSSPKSKPMGGSAFGRGLDARQTNSSPFLAQSMLPWAVGEAVAHSAS